MRPVQLPRPALALLSVLLLSPAARAATRHVWSGSPVNGPGTAWSNAYRDVQSAIDAAATNDAVLVTNGVYATGGRAVYGTFTNRVAITKPITVRSVNGPAATYIAGKGPVGFGAVRCAYVTNGASLVGFTLTNGNTRSIGDSIFERSGGGVWCEPSGSVDNCVVLSNRASNYAGGVYRGIVNRCLVASNSAAYGGGLYGSSAYSCLLRGNSAGISGGGCYLSYLQSCTVVTNRAVTSGGAAYSGSATNSILWGNTSATSNNTYGVALGYSCTFPAAAGVGNLAFDPAFVYPAGNDFHLEMWSPCRDSGTIQPWMWDAMDLDGYPRISRFNVDRGAYEFYFLLPVPGTFIGVLGESTAATVTNAVPYEESFELVSPGTLASAIPGWGPVFEDISVVTNMTYTYGGSLPLPSTSHWNVLRLSTEEKTLTNVVRGAQNGIFLDAMVRLFPSDAEPTIGRTNSSPQIIFISNYSSNLTVWCRTPGSNTPSWHTLPVKIDPETWHRLTVELVYSNGSPAGAYFSTRWDGLAVTVSGAEISPGVPAPLGNGSWLWCATGNPGFFPGLIFGGDGYLDDLVVTAPEPFAPPFWVLDVWTTGPGSTDPAGALAVPVGSETNVVAVANEWSRISSILTNGVSVSGAEDQKSYETTIAAMAAGQTNRVEVAYGPLRQPLVAGVSNEWAEVYYAIEAFALADTNLVQDFMLNIDPTLEYVPSLRITGLEMDGSSVSTTVQFLTNGVPRQGTINGGFVLQESASVSGVFSNIPTSQRRAASFGPLGTATNIVPRPASGHGFYKAAIVP